MSSLASNKFWGFICCILHFTGNKKGIWRSFQIETAFVSQHVAMAHSIVFECALGRLQNLNLEVDYLSYRVFKQHPPSSFYTLRLSYIHPSILSKA